MEHDNDSLTGKEVPPCALATPALSADT